MRLDKEAATGSGELVADVRR